MQPESTLGRFFFLRRTPLARFGRPLVWLVALIATVPGCFPGPPPPPPPPPHQGVVLRVAAPDVPQLRALLLRHGNGWCEQSGATVELVAPGSEADVVAFSPPELPALIAAEKLTVLPEVYSDPRSGDTSGFLRPYRRLIEWRSKKYAQPILGDSLLFAWRADLLNDPTHKKALEQRLKLSGGPATWQDVEIIATYFHESAGWKTSLPPLPSSPEDLDRLFTAWPPRSHAAA